MVISYDLKYLSIPTSHKVVAPRHFYFNHNSCAPPLGCDYRRFNTTTAMPLEKSIHLFLQSKTNSSIKAFKKLFWGRL